jgi:hypothetical protein
MKRFRISLFSKFMNLKIDIPVKIDNSQFYVKINFDRKHDLVYFFITSKLNKELDETTISYIDQAYKNYLNNFTGLHIWNIKRILYLLHKLVTSSPIFDYKKMKRIDLVTTTLSYSSSSSSSSSMPDQIRNHIARTIKQNGKIITIINDNELKNPLITTLLDFHNLNFQLLNALISIDLVSLLNEKNKKVIKSFIGITMIIILNLPSSLTLFNCILNEKLFHSFLGCFNEGSSEIFYMNYILSFLSPILWIVLPKIISFLFRYYFKKILKKYVSLN